MKRLLAAAALAVPLFASANQDLIIGEVGDLIGHDRGGIIIRERGDRQLAIRTSADLAQTLTEISREADRVADQARDNGNLIRSRRFADVAYVSRNLAQDLRQTVLRPLRQGAPLHRISNNLDFLQRDFADLNNAFNVINHVPRHLEEKAREGRHLHQTLKHLL